MAVRAHWSLWVVGALALLWHAGSVLNLGMQMNPELVKQMPESHQAIAKARPAWATIAFGVSAVTGVLGSLALLMRHRICGPLYFLSFIGAFLAVLQAVLTGGALSTFSGFELVLVVAGPVVFGMFLIVFAHRARKLGWLRGTSVE